MAAMQRQCGTFVLGDADRQHVADQKIRVGALDRWDGGERLRQVRQAGIGEYTPSAISAASATIPLRNAASTIGGKAPMPSKDLSFSTKARVSAKGLPGETPSR